MKDVFMMSKFKVLINKELRHLILKKKETFFKSYQKLYINVKA